MPTIILRALEAVLWSKVQAKAQADGCTPKQVVLKAIAQYVAIVVVLLGAGLTIGCSSTVAPTAAPTLPKAVVDCSAVGPLPCQQGPRPAPTPTPDATTVTVRGTVADSISGGLLPNIGVTTGTGATVRTDADGRYEVAPMRSGSVLLVFSAANYFTQTMNLTLAADATIDVVLHRTAPSPAPVPAPTPPPAPAPFPRPTPTPVPLTLTLTLNCTPGTPGTVQTVCNYGATDETGANVTTATGPAEWDFGDGSPHNTTFTTLAQYTYAQAGKYVIAVSTVGQGGRRGSTQVLVTIP
jgi:hypothetical protein